MRLPTGGDLLVDCLVRHGVTHVFSIIGGQMGTIYDAIGRREEIEVVTPRNETGAALMACGFTASSGRISVSMATVGAGVVYEVAGLAKAWFDYIPVVSIAPQVQSYRVKPHQESLQACEQDELFLPITKWNTIVYHWRRIPQMIDRAFREALQGIPGPVHVDIPVDVLFRRKVLSDRRESRLLVEPARTRYAGVVGGDAAGMREAAEALGGSEKPLVLVGQGFGRPGRSRGVGSILEEMELPVLTTTHSSGVMPPESGCYAGDLCAFTRSEQGLEVLSGVDLLVLLGIDRYSKDLVGALDGAAEVIQVELDPRAFVTGRRGLHRVNADPETALAFFAGELQTGRNASWTDQVVSAGRQAAARESREVGSADGILAVLDGIGGDDTILVADGKLSLRVAGRALTDARYRDLFMMDGRDVGGAGLPFAIGAAIANPSDRVILLSDKRALFYHVRELQPAACEGIGIDVICFDDGAAGAVDTASVLDGLGCSVMTFEEPKSAAAFLAGKRAIPRALLL
ncbi:MAG: hypothetical protein KKF41_06185 [Actinobacteria bacterium]|nr:hypothetical protein [Actinomycetota bacterium]MBU2687153.1 hypothetical protein [Actinomycetota bacterium]